MAGKAFDIAVATVSVAGGGLLALEVFNAGILDALAFVGTSGGLAYTLGVYPSMMQDQVKSDLDSRASAWKGDLRDEIRDLFKVMVWCSVMQCVALCCSVLQCVALCCIVLPKFDARPSQRRLRYPRQRLEGDSCHTELSHSSVCHELSHLSVT